MSDDKPREFWIYDTWDPVVARRITLDNEAVALRDTNQVDIFHVIEMGPMILQMNKLVSALETYSHDGYISKTAIEALEDHKTFLTTLADAPGELFKDGE